jgi:FHS family L-fucose permease-like MFS transporter
MWALILVGLFHSIMFPTIFTLAIRGLGPLTEEGSGLMIMAIAGGALVFVQGLLADRFGLQASFVLTAACEVATLAYAHWGARGARQRRLASRRLGVSRGMAAGTNLHPPARGRWQAQPDGGEGRRAGRARAS